MWNGSRDAWARHTAFARALRSALVAVEKEHRKVDEQLATGLWRCEPAEQPGCTVTAKHDFGTTAGDYLFIPGDCGGPEPGTIDLSDDGLPPLAKGSRTNVGGDVVGQNVVSCILELSSCSVVSSEGTRLPRVQDINHLLARHYRERGCYWVDRVRVAIEQLENPSLRVFPDPSGNYHKGMRFAAAKLRAILADLRAKGVC